MAEVGRVTRIMIEAGVTDEALPPHPRDRRRGAVPVFDAYPLRRLPAAMPAVVDYG